jgi:DNA-binding transcriptional LysR family regulator
VSSGDGQNAGIVEGIDEGLQALPELAMRLTCLLISKDRLGLAVRCSMPLAAQTRFRLVPAQPWLLSHSCVREERQTQCRGP